MSYINKELKFIVGSIVGFIIGVVVTAVISPQISGNQFLIPIAIVSLMGFPILLCTRPDMKSLLVTLGVIVVCIIAVSLIVKMQENHLYKTISLPKVKARLK